jgi:hypothetical protein
MKSGFKIEISNYLSFEEMFIVVHDVTIRQRAHFIFQHLFVNSEVRVRVEIIISGGHFFERHRRVGT